MDALPIPARSIAKAADWSPLSPNGLLASLPARDFEQIYPHLRTIELVQETVLIESGQPLKQVYFPHSGVISLVVSLSEGKTVEVAMIGRDSVFGGAAALDGKVSLTSAVVQLPGAASSLEVGLLRAAAERSLPFRTALIRHEQALFAQAMQTAACNASHPVEARLSRWLLWIGDLSGSDLLPLTQEFLAQMIGAHRNRVSLVAHTLQKAGMIRYSRGHIEIIDRDGMMETSCECYAAVKDQYDRLLYNKHPKHESTIILSK
jgi:CRP-like cAMP-binding protein